MRLRHSICKAARRFTLEDDGPSSTEYAIMLALIVLVAVVAIRGIGERMYNVYQNIDSVMP